MVNNHHHPDTNVRTNQDAAVREEEKVCTFCRQYRHLEEFHITNRLVTSNRGGRLPGIHTFASCITCREYQYKLNRSIKTPLACRFCCKFMPSSAAMMTCEPCRAILGLAKQKNGLEHSEFADAKRRCAILQCDRRIASSRLYGLGCQREYCHDHDQNTLHLKALLHW